MWRDQSQLGGSSCIWELAQLSQLHWGLKTSENKRAKSVIRGPYIKGEDAAKPVVELGEAEDVVSGLISESRCRDAVVSAVCGGAYTAVKEVCQCCVPMFLQTQGVHRVDRRGLRST